MRENKNKVVVLALIAIIVLLLGFIGYTFLIKPAFTGFVTRGQNEGVQYAILSIMQQAATCQTVPLTFGNQTINLIAVECLQQAAAQQSQPAQ